MELINGIKKIILDFKIYYTLNFIYPGKNAFKRIKSILPNTISVIEEDVVIEEKVDFGPYLTELNRGYLLVKIRMLAIVILLENIQVYHRMLKLV